MNLPPLSAAPDVSVIIPARDAADRLPLAVASALTQQRPAGFEVVIAVGPSDDDTWEVAERLAAAHAEVRVVGNPAGLTPTALNAAIAASSGEVVVRLDAHAELPPGYVATAIDTLRTTGAVNVGGRQVPQASRGFARAVASAMASRVGSGGAAYRVGTREGPVDTVYLGVFRRAALDEVGAFDPTLVRNQDYELNHRLRQAGGTVWFDPALEVVYRPRGTVEGLWRQYAQYGAWKRHVLRRFPASARSRQFAAPALVLALAFGLLLAVFGIWWPLLTLLLAWLVVLGAGALAAAPRPSQAVAVAVALGVMHLAWGVGFLIGRAVPPANVDQQP